MTDTASYLGPTNYASPIDAHTYGEFQIASAAGGRLPLRRFSDRVTADGSSGFRAEPGRYHLYAGWFCPWSHRATIQRALNGLQNVVSVSYADGMRDARGWAFREGTGPDPVNGFTLLREAYEASEPGYAGAVTIPVLWDRQTETIVSNDASAIDIDLATQFGAWAQSAAETYPVAQRADVDDFDRWLTATVSQRVGRAVYDRAVADELLGAFRRLAARLEARRYLLGDVITVADVRLWVTLVRYDAGANAHRAIGPRLDAYPNLWNYARDLYSRPAFRDTTDFAAFAAPFADLPDWTDASPAPTASQPAPTPR
jgi:putative glutathione S-transferase